MQLACALLALWLSSRTAPAAPPKIDPAAHGLRRLEGKHLTLWTDLAPDDEIAALPGWFDRAYDRWSDYFGIAPLDADGWHITGCLMGSQERFVAAGLYPADLPQFPHGYSRGSQLWLYEQKESSYYRRHLLLHEGVHLFMFAALGSCGPPWYMEGLAELLATHRIDGERIELPIFPKSRDEVPRLGRIKLVQEAVAGDRARTFEEVLAIDGNAFRQNEAYAWSWAASAFLDGHPRYRGRFRRLPAQVTKADFNRRFQQQFADDWPQLTTEWRVFAADLTHGYDLRRMAIAFAPGEALPAAGRTVRIAADRGWQSTGIALAAGKSYRLRASGRFQVDDQPEPWWSEPQGVTARYVNGQPLGRLLAAVVGDEFDATDAQALIHPIPAGRDFTLRPDRDGTLYLRINDSPDSLANNAGEVSVEVEPVDAK